MSSFKTERDIARFIKKQIKSMELRPAFDPIVGSVPGGAQHHHKPQKNALKMGFCVIDFGVRINGYCSDMSRTVFFGKPSKKERRLYNLVLSSQKQAIKRLQSRVIGHELWWVSSKALGRQAKNFIHGLGHGLGKRIHQKPFLKKNSRDILIEGDIVTIEPGIYIKKRFGIRIEDDFLVLNNGARRLSKSPRRLLTFPILS